MVKTKSPKHPRLRGYADLKPSTRNNIAGYMFIGLYIIGLLWFTMYPFVSSIYYSMTDYNTLKGGKFIGFDNFIEMFTEDRRFWKSFWVTLKYSVVSVPLKLASSLLVAVVLSKKTKLTNFYRAAFYVPSLVGGGVAMSLVWKRLWATEGVVNHLLEIVGIPGNDWLTDPNTALWILMLMSLWSFGSQMIIFLAAIKNVPKDLYEAATLDGASKTQQFFKITLPMITSSLFFNLINGVIGALQSFNSAYLISGGAPLNSTLFYGLHQFNKGFGQHEMGYASAMGWFLMVVIAIFTLFTFKHSSQWVYYQNEV